MKSDDEIIGLDVVDDMPDYSKTAEEDWEEYRKRYYKAHGKWLPTYEEIKTTNETA